jgi:hypothetical protein
MQYFKPEGNYFAGDCMPFYFENVFRLYYLLDENHHGALGGLGGHQWTQASTHDLIHWEHHPLAIPITEAFEGSICTGSVINYQGRYYGFYATRRRDWMQHLSLAVSEDGVRFEKVQPNPLASPPAGYDPLHYRDPAVFQDEAGVFHLLVTACLQDWPIPGRGGCLAHLVSNDLFHWENREPFIIPGLAGAPECPDYFAWNGWYYLVFSNEGVARYRMSRQPFGPWLRPRVDTLDGPAARVIKTAAFGPNRRIGAAWIGTRLGNKDRGQFQFGGNILLRELIQLEDGSLGAKFLDEMNPAGDAVGNLSLTPVSAGAKIEGRQVHLAARQGLEAAVCNSLPRNGRLKLRVTPGKGAVEFGLRLRAEHEFDSGADLRFSPGEKTVHLNQEWLFGVEGLEKPFDLEIILWQDLIDVSINNNRTLVDRCPEKHGDRLFFYAQDSAAAFELVETNSLIP